MRKVLVFALLIIGAFALTALLATAEEGAAPKHEFVGADKCKICHKDVFTAWQATGHAKAFDVLSDEEKKKPECVSCHITGKLADGTQLNGVQCEMCHGAGSDYKSPKIKSKTGWANEREKYVAMAKEAGLILSPTEEDCKRCHKKEGNPNFKEFKFEEAKKLVHPVAKTEG